MHVFFDSILNKSHLMRPWLKQSDDDRIIGGAKNRGALKCKTSYFFKRNKSPRSSWWHKKCQLTVGSSPLKKQQKRYISSPDDSSRETFSSLVERVTSPLKGSLNHLKKVTLNHQVYISLARLALCFVLVLTLLLTNLHLKGDSLFNLFLGDIIFRYRPTTKKNNGLYMGIS